MKRTLCLLLSVLLVLGPAFAQTSSDLDQVVSAIAEQSDGYSAAELDELLGPIALYPDPLLSNILAAATVSEDMKTGWDASVNALCFYPDVLDMMVDTPEWTVAIGWASANQLSDVMDSVQRFRFQAKSAGNLKTDDKMQIIEEGTVIRIESAQPEIIYVPQYEPEVVVVQQSSDFGTVLGYSAGIAAKVLLWRNVFH